MWHDYVSTKSQLISKYVSQLNFHSFADIGDGDEEDVWPMTGVKEGAILDKVMLLVLVFVFKIWLFWPARQLSLFATN